jgi:hypothetical protein
MKNEQYGESFVGRELFLRNMPCNGRRGVVLYAAFSAAHGILFGARRSDA